MNERSTSLKRKTNETDIELTLNLDGVGNVQVSTGLGFFDHMLTALAFHAGWDLSLTCNGDLHVDDHHTIEDCGLSLGAAILEIVADKSGVQRFSSKFAPLDESLARAVLDFSGRPSAIVNLDLQRDAIGEVACENLTHFFPSLASAGKFTLHVDVLRGGNDHHRAEAAFKATALAFREALALKSTGIPSTKGVL